MPLVALVQLNGSSNIERNLSRTEEMVRRAAAGLVRSWRAPATVQGLRRGGEGKKLT